MSALLLIALFVGLTVLSACFFGVYRTAQRAIVRADGLALQLDLADDEIHGLRCQLLAAEDANVKVRAEAILRDFVNGANGIHTFGEALVRARREGVLAAFRSQHSAFVAEYAAGTPTDTGLMHGPFGDPAECPCCQMSMSDHPLCESCTAWAAELWEVEEYRGMEGEYEVRDLV